MNNLSTKERLDKNIFMLYHENFDFMPKKLEAKEILAEIEQSSKVMTFSLALLKLLAFLSQNAFKDGKLHLPIWKWSSIITSIREFLKNI